MRTDAAEADRRATVRDAARRWRKAEAIDDATRDAILAGSPDDRRRLGPAFRTLVWIFTFVAIHAFFGIVMLALSGVQARGRVDAFVALAYGLFLCAAAEALISFVRCREMGAESAAAVTGVGYVLVGFALLLDASTSGSFPLTTWLIAACVVCSVAAWRWGYPLAAGLAAMWAFALLARAPGGRLVWLMAGPVAALVGLRASDSERLAPSLRDGARAVAAVALVALYTALHLGSWDHGLVELIGGRSPGPLEGPLRSAAILATAIVPGALLVVGILTRRTILLRLGLLLGLASVVTLRFYVHVMPLWLALALGGSAAIALALAVRRYLHGGPGGERAGFTADPLFDRERGRGVLEIAAAVASLSPAAAPPAPESSLEAGGGRYGGGGASGTY